MGAVFAAVDEQNGQPCAIKVIHPHVARAGVNAERFRREVTLAQQLGHPGIVRVFDAGHDPKTGLFMVMELLQGVTFRLPLSQGDLTAGQALEVTVAMLDALQAAHHAGIVHRDLKPDNIFLHAPDGQMPQVKLLDFGVARHRNTAGLTTTNVGLGTPHFMAPEQATDARSVTPASDVWSAGVILYYIFSGALPFDGDGPYETVLRACTERHVPLNERAPELDYRFVDIVEMCLEKDPVERFQDAGELFEVLAPLASDPKVAGDLMSRIAAEPRGTAAELMPELVSDRAVVLPVSRPSVPQEPSSMPALEAPPPAPRRSAPWLAFVAVLTALVAVVAWQVDSHDRVIGVESLAPTAGVDIGTPVVSPESPVWVPPPLPVPRTAPPSEDRAALLAERERPRRRKRPITGRTEPVPKRTGPVPVPKGADPIDAADETPRSASAAPVTAAVTEDDVERPAAIEDDRAEPIEDDRVERAESERQSSDRPAARALVSTPPPALTVRTATRTRRPVTPAVRRASPAKSNRAKEPVEPDFVTF